MSIKRLGLKFMVKLIRAVYAPLKLRKKRNQVTIISRQSNAPTWDIALLSDYITENYPDVTCKVMCRKIERKSIITYPIHMISQMANMAVSRVVVLDSYCIAASVLNHKPGLKIIQMWHSMAAIKAFGYQSIGKSDGRDCDIADVLCMHRNYDFIIAPSQHTGKIFAEAFNTKESKVKIMGLPRTDFIMKARRGGEEAKAFREKIRLEYGVKDEQEIILYAPTFRKHSEVDVERLVEAIDSEKYKLIIKLHPLYDNKNYSDKKYDTLRWMMACDRIITDYSALGVEASLLEKPLYFYVYDIDEYNKTQGLNVDPREEIPNATAINASDLSELLEKDYDYDQLSKFREKYISINTFDCTKQLGDFIYELIKKEY